MTGGIGVDKPLGKLGSLSLNYMYSRGEHLFLTRNINAPLTAPTTRATPTAACVRWGSTKTSTSTTPKAHRPATAWS